MQGGYGARWNPDTFTALYTSFEQNGAIAEVYAHLARAPVFSTADKDLHQLHVNTQRTLHLQNRRVLSGLGLDIFNASDQRKLLARCQEIGAAAHLLEYDSMIVPSLQWDCDNLVIFPEILPPDHIVPSGKSRPINWAAWREKFGEAAHEYVRKNRHSRHGYSIHDE